MNEGLHYSEDGLLNRILYFSDSNEINLVVEDEHKEYVYQTILSRMFKDKIQIPNVFPMNGKKGVEHAFQEFGEIYDGKPMFYLVDGDFDFLLEKEMIVSPQYIYLRRYNIESYYIDEMAIVKFVAAKSKKSFKIVKESMGFSEWEENTYEILARLFLVYAAVQSGCREEKNVGLSPHGFLHENGAVRVDAIDAYENRIKNKIPNYKELYERLFERLHTAFLDDKTCIVCGKYLLASLAKYLRDRLGIGFKDDEFQTHLLNTFDVHSLDYVKESIVNCLT